MIVQSRTTRSPKIETECTHCGQPVPSQLAHEDSEEQFCCHGCEAAFRILQEFDGLDPEFLEQARIAAKRQTAAQSYEHLDHPAYMEKYVHETASGISRTKLLLGGVHCASCLFVIEKLPEFLPGVLTTRMNLTAMTVTVEWITASTRLSKIAETLDRLGYPPFPPLAEEREKLEQVESHRQLIRLAIAGACAGNTMLVAIALYFGWFTGMSDEFLHLFRWTIAGLAAVSLAWPGSVFFRGAWQAIRTRTSHMDLPVALGLSAGAGMGLANTILQRGEIYFDSLTVLVFLLLVGRHIQYGQQRRAIRQVSLLHAMLPRAVTRLVHPDPDAGLESVPIEAIRPGDWIHVRAGDVIPVDGKLVCGSTLIDLSILTGESCGVEARQGDRVYSGSTNISSSIVIETTLVGTDTRIGKICELVEEEIRTRTPIVQLANRIGNYFVAIVLVLAAITVAIWMSSGMEIAINHAMALLIVACPCALGLATPFSVAFAQGRAAARGILVKSGEVFESLARPGRIWLDKTGTLTEGRMRLIDFVGDRDVQPAVDLLERQTVHPIAAALIANMKVAEQDRLPQSALSNFLVIPGIGIQALVNGQLIQIGSEKLLEDKSTRITVDLHTVIQDFNHRGLTTVLVVRNGEVIAVAALGDQIRADAKATIAELTRLGWDVGILSGDHQDVASHVGQEIGIEQKNVQGNLTPEEKLEVVQNSATSQTVVMVGDGVNDSAALAAASVGVAVQGGAEASLKAANVYLTRDGVQPILDAIRGSQQTLRTIHTTFAISLCYNAFAVVLAMSGMINPIVAAILMPISSLSVLAVAASNTAFRNTSIPPQSKP
ncbi:putative copper-importing P-type ATPase A [Bremerella volcania]|uniref:Putative copper-importing P-type ATPase A n=2 Tax=Bremerella volcania TaxID=2527984 RepID=A0A518CC50_9BACT|nr:putative copper-importing P-type ATPase A [Bremerella volcania]